MPELGRHRRRRIAAAGVTLAATIACAAPAQAQDAVLDWNLRAFQAVSAPAATPPNPDPTVQVQHLAMVHGAVFDAVNAIAGGYEPYLGGVSAPDDASQRAAVAAAAHGVLLGLPLSEAAKNTVQGHYLAALAAIPAGDAKDDGIAAGAAAAQEMLDARANDRRFASGFSFEVGTDVGEWRPTTGTLNHPFAWVQQVEPFVLESPTQLATEGPNPVGSDAYLEEYDEVKAVGAANRQRSAHEQAVVDVHNTNPVELFNRTMRGVADAQDLSLVETARLFALMEFSAADAIINTWADKAKWSFWRPITAIRLGDSDGDPRTIGDTGWTSYIPAPPYPDHPSGYTALSTGMLMAARWALGTDKVAFTVKHASNGAQLPASGFNDAVRDVVDARVWQGIHFRTADTQAAALGRKAAKYVHKHALVPVD